MAKGASCGPCAANGIPYQGINVLMLWSEAMEKGYAAPIWMTFKQALELKANVRKGEHGSLVVYADKIIRTETDSETGEEAERAIPFMKGYTVFNIEQIEGLPEHYLRQARAAQRDRAADRARGILLCRDRRERACMAAAGLVTCPRTDQRADAAASISSATAESYYATLAHETTHWTRHPSRLDRDFGRKRFGDEGYAMEELVAELGSAFLSADLELTPEVREDHAAYIASWIKVLKDDKRAIFTAASHAQRAADFLHGLQNPAADQADAA